MALGTVGQMRLVQSASTLFRKGLLPGAAFGFVVGLVPGLLLILVLGGGNYHVGGGEVLSFTVLSIGVLTAVGAALGGAFGIVVGIVSYAIRKLASRRQHR